MTFGAIATPDTYYEFRMQQAEAMKAALGVFDEVEREFESFSGRRYGAVDAYNTDRADVVMVINGSAAGTMRAAARAAERCRGERRGPGHQALQAVPDGTDRLPLWPTARP